MINAFGRDIKVGEALLKVMELANHCRRSRFLGDYLRIEKRLMASDALIYLGLHEQEFQDHGHWNYEVARELELFKKELLAEIDCLVGLK